MSEYMEERIHRNISGEDKDEVTPVPIPNTEVKLIVADDSKGFPLLKIGICQIFLCPKAGKIWKKYKKKE